MKDFSHPTASKTLLSRICDVVAQAMFVRYRDAHDNDSCPPRNLEGHLGMATHHRISKFFFVTFWSDYPEEKILTDSTAGIPVFSTLAVPARFGCQVLRESSIIKRCSSICALPHNYPAARGIPRDLKTLCNKGSGGRRASSRAKFEFHCSPTSKPQMVVLLWPLPHLSRMSPELHQELQDYQVGKSCLPSSRWSVGGRSS